jgi:hypothetical protein
MASAQHMPDGNGKPTVGTLQGQSVQGQNPGQCNKRRGNICRLSRVMDSICVLSSGGSAIVCAARAAGSLRGTAAAEPRV